MTLQTLFELTGKIISKEPKKVYDKKSPYYLNTYFRLKVLTENQETHVFFVYPNLVSKVLWKTIQESQCIDKRYIFCLAKKKGRLILHDWEELERGKYA